MNVYALILLQIAVWLHTVSCMLGMIRRSLTTRWFQYFLKIGVCIVQKAIFWILSAISGSKSNDVHQSVVKSLISKVSWGKRLKSLQNFEFFTKSSFLAVLAVEYYEVPKTFGYMSRSDNLE